MLKGFTLVCLALIFSNGVYAQVAKGYRTAQSIMENTPDTIDNIMIVGRSKSSKKWSGKNDYKITGDYRLNKEFIAVEYNDSMFVNCGALIKEKGYAHVLFRTPRYFYFLATRSKTRGINPHSNSEAMWAYAYMGGMVGATIAYTQDPERLRRFEYLYDLQHNEVIGFNSAMKRKYLREASPTDDADFIAFVQQLIKNREEQENQEYAERVGE